MLDFSLTPYEWHNNMKIIMQNIALDRIEFNIDNSILFSFSNTYNGEPHKKLLCRSVWKFSAENNCEEDAFPYFTCDVRMSNLENMEIRAAFDYLKYGFGEIPDSSEYILICMDGDMGIELICSHVEIIIAGG